MPTVAVRDAHRGDARAIAAIWAAAVPYLVRSSARAAADLREDKPLGRRRWVGLLGTEVAGTATARLLTGTTDASTDDGREGGGREGGGREALLSVEVRPDLGSRGVGTALLVAAATAFADVGFLHVVSTDDPVAMAFAVRNGFLPEGEQLISVVDTAAVAPAGPAPDGVRAVRLDALPDLRLLLAAHNALVAADAGGLRRPLSMSALRSQWWNSPDNAPDLSWGLLAETGSEVALAAFTSVQVDRERGRCWSGMTATQPAYRGRGLARWVSRRTLTGLHEAGLGQARTAADATDVGMLGLHEDLGYRTVARSVHMGRRRPR
jgi:GNAT superfamily N-acetyltransferase